MPSSEKKKSITTENTWAPVVVFAYNRLDHLQECLRALERAEGSADSEVYIFSDGYKGDQDRDKVAAVQDYLHEYEKSCPFQKIHVTYATGNKGLAESVIGGVGKVIGEYGRAIVVEDDLVVSPDFLAYMNSALRHYEQDRRIWQIGGWSPEVPELDSLKEDTFLWYRSNSWGWATWADRWDTVDWDVRDYKGFKFSMLKRHKMNRGGADMADMLDMQMQGKINSWAIRFAYAESMNDMFTVFPKKSRVINCGRDGSGTNCHAVNDGTGSLEKGAAERLMGGQAGDAGYLWGGQAVQKETEKKIYRFFSGSRRSCLKRMVRSMACRIGVKK